MGTTSTGHVYTARPSAADALWAQEQAAAERRAAYEALTPPEDAPAPRFQVGDPVILHGWPRPTLARVDAYRWGGKGWDVSVTDVDPASRNQGTPYTVGEDALEADTTP
jgi:hypothetical protein